MSNEKNERAPLEYEGKIVSIGEIASVKEWKKFSMILDTTQADSKRPEMLAVEWFGKEVPRWHASIGVGKRVKIKGRVSSRDYNGKWYTNVSIYYCSPLSASEDDDRTPPPFDNSPIPPPPNQDYQEIPF